MKRLLFLLVSACFAVSGYCSNVSDKVVSVFNDNDEATVEQKKNQPLILQKVGKFVNGKLSSHYSHQSHYSHRSHYSSR